MNKLTALILGLLGLSSLGAGGCGQKADRPAYCDQIHAGGYLDELCGELTGCALNGCNSCQFCDTDVVCEDFPGHRDCTCTGDLTCHELCGTDSDCPAGQTCETVDLYYNTTTPLEQSRYCR